MRLGTMSDIDNDTSKKETRIERWIDRQRGGRERERREEGHIQW